MTPPTGLHVLVLPSGARGPVAPAETCHRYLALYGEGYAWDHPTAEELARYQEEQRQCPA